MDNPRAFVDRIAGGYQDAMILLAANHLGVFGALATNPTTADDLAHQLGTDPRATAVLLRALVGAGMLHQPTTNTFALLSELQPLLDPDGAETMHSILDHHQHLLGRWAQLVDVVRTGRPVDQSQRPRTDRSLRAFICGMRDISRRSSEDVADLLPELGQRRRLLDLGGGPGTSALTFCRRFSRLSAVVLDLPAVTAIAREQITTAGLADRVTTLDGDFLVDPLLAPDAAPYDVVYASNVIHMLAPADTGRLIRRAGQVLAPGGLLVIKEFFLDDTGTAPAFGARFAVNMLVGTEGGKSYGWTETEAMAAAAGFDEFRRIPVAVNSGLLVARNGDPS